MLLSSPRNPLLDMEFIGQKMVRGEDWHGQENNTRDEYGVFFKGGKSYELACAVGLLNGQKLHDISNGMALSTMLYQTTGNAVGNGGFLNITGLKGGKVGFGAITLGSKAKLEAMYVKSVKEIQGEVILDAMYVERVQDLRPADHHHGGSENPRRRHYYWSHSVRCPGSVASTMPWVRCFHDALDSLPPRLHKKIHRYVSFTELIPAFHINPSRGMTIFSPK
ncbi:hypothetical protein KI387_033219 [Taxus chinensis]|uniref:Uncharacterized protein n=1 Tax=Taxus chinensis TaxID=29808 RepID=A0AA38C385_TAXCH|nr:hypothetical protein KI387_033219 [Taxus chinensis]